MDKSEDEDVPGILVKDFAKELHRFCVLACGFLLRVGFFCLERVPSSWNSISRCVACRKGTIAKQIKIDLESGKVADAANQAWE